MSDKLTVAQSFFCAHFYDIQAGSEKDALKHLRDRGYQNVYKALGTYDIVAFSEADAMDLPRLYQSIPQAHASCTVAAYSFKTQNYQSPNLPSYIGRHRLVGFVLLEIAQNDDPDSYIGLKQLGSKIAKRIDECAKECDVFAAIYGGLGRSDIYVLACTKNIVDIWKFTRKIRGLTWSEVIDDSDSRETIAQGPIFSQTHTIPLISYDCIDNSTGAFTVSEIIGETHAAISVICPPGIEGVVSTYFPKERYTLQGVLGEMDVFIRTNEPASCADIVADILNFRENCSITHGARVNTATLIASAIEPRSSTYISRPNLKNQPPLEITISQELSSRSPRLANRIITIIHRINEHLASGSFQPALKHIVAHVAYLKGLNTEYVHFEESDIADSGYCSESQLQNALENIETALSQRLESRFSSLYSGYSVPLPLGDGVKVPLLAVEKFLSFIFSCWLEQNAEDLSPLTWEGYPVFSDSFGFQLREGEAFFLPATSLYDCAADEGNWLTLTHEVSHAIYARLGVLDINEEQFQSLLDTSFKNTPLDNKIDFFDFLNELFTHWYDYIHFYAGDIDEFLRMIWGSWKKLPVVHRNISEYYLRSYLIYLYSNQEDLPTLSNDYRDQASDFARKKWSEHMEKLKKIVPSAFTFVALEELQDQAEYFCETGLRFLSAVGIFYKNYENIAFRDAINKPYANIEDHVQSILQGTPISEEIPNPYLLVKKVIITLRNSNCISSGASVALALSIV